MPLLEVKNLRKFYGVEPVLRDVSFNLDRGEVVALTGINGAGKSTLLKCIAEALKPDSGEVLSQAKRVGIELGPRASMLYGLMTIRENLELYACLYGVKEPEVPIEQALTRLQLLGEQSKQVSLLSEGMLRRASLARALLGRPELLLLDEPFSNLDANARATLKAILQDYRKLGTSALIVLHEQDISQASPDRILELQHGRLKQRGFENAISV